MKAILLSLLLSGCASGIDMTSQEADACKQFGCTVWTEGELMQLIRRAWTEGYAHGKASI